MNFFLLQIWGDISKKFFIIIFINTSNSPHYTFPENFILYYAMTILFHVWGWTSYSGLLRIAKTITNFEILRAIFQEETWNLHKWSHFFIYCFSSICLQQWFFNLKIIKVCFHWLLLQSIMVYKIPEFFEQRLPCWTVCHSSL